MPEVDYAKLWPDCPVEIRHLTQEEWDASAARNGANVPSQGANNTTQKRVEPDAP
jgi:hypothetical protein